MSYRDHNAAFVSACRMQELSFDEIDGAGWIENTARWIARVVLG
jgi:hypothetical protein